MERLPPPCTILCVDDCPEILQVCRRILTCSSSTVATAGSLGEARRVLYEGLPDVVVTDFDLGHGRRGTELLDEIGRRWPSIRRVLVSGSPLVARDRPWDPRHPPDVMLAKPFTVAELRNAVRPAFEWHHSESINASGGSRELPPALSPRKRL